MSAVVDKQLVRELEHRDARRRKKAIETLGDAESPSAIKLLLAVSRQDADPALRKLALDIATARNAKMVEEIIAEKTQPKKPSTRLTPAQEESKKRAKAASEVASNYQHAGNDAEALKFLARALLIYPDIRDDNYFMNIVQAITGEDGDAGLALIPPVKKTFLESLFGQ